MLEELRNHVAQNRLRALEGVSLAGTGAALLLTVILYGSNYAAESNGVAELLIAQLGWQGAAGTALICVALAFAACRHALDSYPRVALGGGAFIASASIVDLANNLHVLSKTGIPDGLPPVTPEIAATITVLSAVLFVRPDPRVVERAWTTLDADTRATVTKAGAVAFAAMLVVQSAFAFGLVGLFATDNAVAQDPEGSHDGKVYGGGNDGTISAADPETGGSQWSISKSNVRAMERHPGGYLLAGEYDGSLHAIDPADGSTMWTHTFSEDVVGIHATPGGDTAYVFGGEGTMFKFNLTEQSVEWEKSVAGNIIASEASPDRSQFAIAAGQSTRLIDDTGVELWKSTPHSDVADDVAYSAEAGRVYSVDVAGGVYAFNVEDGSVEWSDSHGSQMDAAHTHGDTVYVGGRNNALVAYSHSGEQKWTSGTGDTVMSISSSVEDHGLVYTGNGNNVVTAHSADGGGTEWSDDSYTSFVSAVSGADERVASPSDPVSGTVTDQSGAPVSNATVEVWGVSESVTDPQSELDDVSDPRPPEWDSDLSILGSGGVLDTANSEVALAYSPESIGDRAWVDSADLQDASLSVPANERVALVVWNPTKNPGLLGNTDEYNSQLPGAKSSGTVVLEKLSPSGEATETIRAETSETAGGGWGDPSSLDYAEVALNPGFYRVYPEGSPESSYVIVAGGVDAVTESIRDSLEDVQGQVTDRAQSVSQKVSDGTFSRVTAETNADGEFSADVPSGYSVVGIQSYKYGGLLTDVSVDSRSMDRAEGLMDTSNYSGQVYLPREPTYAEPPASDVTVNTIGVGYSPHQSLSDYQRAWDEWRDYLANWTDSELPSMIQDQLGDYNHSELSDLKEELSSLHDENEDLREKYEQALEEVRDASNISVNLSDTSGSEQELREEISALQESIQSIESEVGVDDSVSIGNETASYDVSLPQSVLNPVGADVSTDDIVVLAHYSNGTTETVNQSYVSIDDTQLTSGQMGDTIRVQDYPIPEDVASVRFEVVADTSNGLVKESGSVQNPQFSGARPGVDSIAISSLHPQVGETVTVSLDPDDETVYDGIQSVHVAAPDGSTVNTSVSNGEATIPVEQAGAYHVEVVYANAGGHEFSEVFRFEAREETFSNTPSVRLKQGVNGEYALAAGMEDADLDRRADGGHEVYAQFERGESPGEVHVYPSETLGADGDVKLSVVEGDAQQSVSKRVIVHAHMGELSDNAIIYRAAGGDAQPIKPGGNQYGEVVEQSGNGTVVKTYTTEQGAVELRVNNDPGLVDRVQYRVDVFIAGLPVDVGGLNPFHAGGGVAVFGAFVFVTRRRVSG